MTNDLPVPLMIEEFVAEKFSKLDEGSFVPHKGVQVYHIDGSFFCFFGAFLEKIGHNDMVYIAVYSKNHGAHLYSMEDIESYHEFNISVPTTLNTQLKKKSQETPKESVFTKLWQFIKKMLCIS